MQRNRAYNGLRYLIARCLRRAEDVNALGLSERRILQTIFGGVFEHGVWKRRMNHELVELYGEPIILTVAKA